MVEVEIGLFPNFLKDKLNPIIDKSHEQIHWRSRWPQQATTLDKQEKTTANI